MILGEGCFEPRIVSKGRPGEGQSSEVLRSLGSVVLASRYTWFTPDGANQALEVDGLWIGLILQGPCVRALPNPVSEREKVTY